MLIISAKFEVDTTIHRRVTALWVRTRYVNFTFDLLTLDNVQTWQVTWATPPPSLKILCLSVMSYDVRHRPPLTMRLEPE